jgi:hypothetical protein
MSPVSAVVRAKFPLISFYETATLVAAGKVTAVDASAATATILVLDTLTGKAGAAEYRLKVGAGGVPKAAVVGSPAAILLGRVRESRAVPALTGVLKDVSAPLDGLIAVVRALGRIGDRSAVPALEGFLARNDLPTERVLRASTPAGRPVVLSPLAHRGMASGNEERL